MAAAADILKEGFLVKKVRLGRQRMGRAAGWHDWDSTESELTSYDVPIHGVCSAGYQLATSRPKTLPKLSVLHCCGNLAPPSMLNTPVRAGVGTPILAIRY